MFFFFLLADFSEFLSVLVCMLMCSIYIFLFIYIILITHNILSKGVISLLLHLLYCIASVLVLIIIP